MEAPELPNKNIETYRKEILNWEDTIFGNKKEIATKSGKNLAWFIICLLFFEANAFGIIPYKYLFVYRQVRISDLIFLALMVYSLLSIYEIKKILRYSYFFKIVLLLVSYITFELFISSINYDFDIIEYIFRIIEVYKILIIIPFVLLIKRNSIYYFAKLAIFFGLIMSFIYILNALFGFQTLEGTAVAYENLGGVIVKRVYGSTFGSEYFFLLMLFLLLVNKTKSLINLLIMSLLLAPTILAFGRNAWVVMAVSIFLLFLVISLKKRSISGFFKGGIAIVIILLIVLLLALFFYPGFSDLTYALNERFVQGREEIIKGTGSYGLRIIVDIPIFLTIWSQNPIFGLGVHDYWVLGSSKFMSAAFSDVNWAGVLAAYGIVGFILYIFFTIKAFKISYKGLKKIEYDSIGYFFAYLPFALILASLLNYSNMFPINIYLSYTCLDGIIWGMPVMIEYYLKQRPNNLR